jgi:UDP-N-acetylglucosamine 2-epimerase
VHVDDDAGLCCALAAARLGVAIVRIGGVPSSGPGRVIAHLADVLLTRSPLDDASRPATLAPERSFVIGNPLVDVVQRDARAALALAAWRRFDVAPGAYDLVVLAGHVPFADIARRLGTMASGFPLVLEAPAGYEVPGARVVTSPTFLERLSLERAARSIFTDSMRVHEEAAVLGVPCHSIGDNAPLVAVEQNLATPVTCWDRRAGLRAADALVANFARVRLSL